MNDRACAERRSVAEHVPSLFRPQRLDRINARGSAGGEVACERRDRHEQDAHAHPQRTSLLRFLWPRLPCEHASSPEDRPFQGLERRVVEALPDIACEAIECLPIHVSHEPAPAVEHDRRDGRLQAVVRR